MVVWATRRRIALGAATIVAVVVVVVVLVSRGSSNPTPVTLTHARWQVQPAPVAVHRVTDGRAILHSVSCPTAHWCMVVGYDQYRRRDRIYAQPLVELDSNGHWRPLNAPAAPHAGVTQLYGVTCRSTSMCMIVGSTTTAARGANLGGLGVVDALLWDGRSLRLSLNPAPTVHALDDTLSNLNAVSCPTTRDCIAVGVALQNHPIAEHWNGVSWTSQALPMPRSARGAMTPAALSCPEVDDCMMVANINRAVFPTGPPVVERWNGSGWRVVPGPGGNRDSELESVVCPTAESCTVAGPSGNGGARITTWTPAGWASGYSLPASGSSNFPTYYFAGVSCMGGACTAVGAYNPSGDMPSGWLGVSASGTSSGWRGGPIAQPARRDQTTSSHQALAIGALNSVSCFAPDHCVAVGSATGLNGKALVATGS